MRRGGREQRDLEARVAANRQRQRLEAVLIASLERADHLANAVHLLGRGGERGRLEPGKSLLQVRDDLALVLGLGLQTLERRRQFLGRDGHMADAPGDDLAAGVQRPERARAADEFETNATAKSLGRQHGDQADRPGPRHVRAAARRQIVALHVDDPERAASLGLLAQRQRGRLGFADEPDPDRAVLPDDAVGLGFPRRNRRGGQIDRQVHRGDDRAEVEPHRARVVQTIERRREEVLAGVLLHVIEPAPAIDHAADTTAHFDLPIDHVPHVTGS